MNQYQASERSADETKLAQQFVAAQVALNKDGMTPAIEALRDGRLDAVRQLVTGEISTLGPVVTAAVAALRRQQVDGARHEYEDASARSALLRNVMIAAILLGMGAAALAGLLLVRSVYRQLGGQYGPVVTHRTAGRLDRGNRIGDG